MWRDLFSPHYTTSTIDAQYMKHPWKMLPKHTAKMHLSIHALFFSSTHLIKRPPLAARLKTNLCIMYPRIFHSSHILSSNRRNKIEMLSFQIKHTVPSSFIQSSQCRCLKDLDRMFKKSGQLLSL